jgi:phosphatidate cytidylyltransferase
MNQRVISGVLGAALLLFLIYAGGLYFTLAIGLLVVLGILEYIELLKRQKLRPQIHLLLFCPLLLLALLHIQLSTIGLNPWEGIFKSERIITLVIMITFFAFLTNELLRGTPEHGMVNAAANLFGAVYIGAMFAYILLLRHIPGQNGFYVLFTILVTWANDSLAYFVGINFGKHKLSPRISPNKSVEGSIGGLVGGLVVALVMALFTRRSVPIYLVLGTLVVVAGQFGDLAESVIKRNAGVKDSGSFLPGHGGLLDRFDSLLLAAPVVYYMIAYVLPH